MRLLHAFSGVSALRMMSSGTGAGVGAAASAAAASSATRFSHVSVVSTASRGIGQEFARQLLLRHDDGCVVGLVRSAEVPVALQDLQREYGVHRLVVITGVDLEEKASTERAAAAIKQACLERGSNNTPQLDLLVNVAGILGDGKPGPERSVTNLDRDWLEKTMQVNLIGHAHLTSLLVPLLKRSSSSSSGSSSGAQEPSRVVNVSARVGSIGDNNLGGWYSYRMSKAALNMFTKTLSIEMKRFNCICLSIHPGTTDTDLSKPFQKNVRPEKLFAVSSSVKMMLDVIFALKKEETGAFVAYDGSKIEY